MIELVEVEPAAFERAAREVYGEFAYTEAKS